MTPSQEARPALEKELAALALATRERRSVDSFARAALLGFSWSVLAGVCGKLLWDSARPPLFLYPLALLDLLLLWDAVQSYRRGRAQLDRESRALDRLLEVRSQLGIDPRPQPAAQPGALLEQRS